MSDIEDFNNAVDRLHVHLGAWAGRHETGEIRVRSEADHARDTLSQLYVLLAAIAARVEREASDYDVETAAILADATAIADAVRVEAGEAP